MADKVLDFQIKVNTDTGQLTALGSEFQKTAGAAKGMGDTMDSAAGQAQNLFAQLAPFAGAAGILMFFKDSVTAANEQEEALRRLGFALTSNGTDWNASKESVTAWSLGIQDLTRFSQTEALNALGQMSRATKDLDQAQTGVKVAMGLSVATGRDFASSLDLIQGLMMGNQRATLMAHKELGTYVGTATTAQEMLTALKAKFEDAATSEDSFTKSTKQAANQLAEVQKTVGQDLIPVLTTLLGWFKSLIDGVKDFGTVAGGIFVTLVDGVKGWAAALRDYWGKNLKGVEADFKEMNRNILIDEKTTVEQLGAADKERNLQETLALLNSTELKSQASAKELTAEQIATAKFLELHNTLAADLDKIGQQSVEKRLAENASLMAAEVAKVGQIKNLSAEQTAALLADIAKLKAAKDADIRNDTANAAKVEQIHLDLAKKMDALGIQTLAKKKANLDIELKQTEDKINKEITDEKAKGDLIAQAEALNRAQKAALDNAAWTDYAKTVSGALKSTTDAMGAAFAQQLVEGKSFSDAMKQIWTQLIEKMIEELVALIVKLVIVEALEVATGLGGGGGGAGGALAGNMLSAFTRAEGGTNIVDKPTLFLAGEAGPEIASFTPMSKVGRTDTGGNTSKMAGSGVGTDNNAVGSPGGGSSNITVGNIYVSLQLASMAPGDRQSMLKQLGNEIRTASVDAVRFAVASANLANRNAGVAV